MNCDENSKEDYYLENKKRMIQSVKAPIQHIKISLLDYYDQGDVEEIIRQIDSEFATLLPQIPYIGGMDNLLTKQLVGSAPSLALYKVLIRKGLPVTEIGKIIYKSSVLYWNSYPKILGPVVRWYFTGRGYLQGTLARSAEVSQNRKYQGDFVFEAVDGTGKDFDYGIDYTQCGICKFFHEQHADEIARYVCLSDFAQSDAFIMGLTRTETIAEGGNRCDFRFHKGIIVKRDLSRYFD